jgi:quercetin dioxygenase-like cupin family protein
MQRCRIAIVLPVFVAGLVIGAAVPVFGHLTGPKVTNLLTAALAMDFTPDREILIDLVEIPPNQKLDWHWHPGEEFHYYLAGNPVIELVDAPPIIGKPGTVGHVGFKQRHQASAGDRGATIIVFRVHTRGEPWRYLDDSQDSGFSGVDGDKLLKTEE